MSVLRRVAAPFILIAAVGCAAASAGSPGGSPIETDRTVYPVHDTAGLASLTIRMTYHNTTGKDVYLPTCQGPQPPRLQKEVNGSWIVAFAPNVLACESAPIIVRSGSSYDYTFRILAGMPGSNYVPRFAVGELPGTYRILWELFSSTSGDPRRPSTTRDPLPVEQEISNKFRLVR